MKSEPTESSSDLDSARELSRNLVSARAGSPSPAPPPDDYVRFTFSSVVRRGVAGGPGLRRPATVEPEAQRPESATTWDEFLARSLPAAQGEAAFLMDAQGLLVAGCGPIPAADLEGIGARLMAALEHARKMQLEEGHDPAVVVELGTAWLTGFAVSLRDGSTMTMGVVGPAALHAETRARLSGALWRWRASLEAPGGGHAP